MKDCIYPDNTGTKLEIKSKESQEENGKYATKQPTNKKEFMRDI